MTAEQPSERRASGWARLALSRAGVCHAAEPFSIISRACAVGHGRLRAVVSAGVAAALTGVAAAGFPSGCLPAVRADRMENPRRRLALPHLRQTARFLRARRQLVERSTWKLAPPQGDSGPPCRSQPLVVRRSRRLGRSLNWEPEVPIDLPPFLADLLSQHVTAHPRQRCACAERHGGSAQYVFLGPKSGHHRRSNYARRVFRPAADGCYEAEKGQPGKLVIADSSQWPGRPIADRGVAFVRHADRVVLVGIARQHLLQCDLGRQKNRNFNLFN